MVQAVSSLGTAGSDIANSINGLVGHFAAKDEGAKTLEMKKLEQQQEMNMLELKLKMAKEAAASGDPELAAKGKAYLAKFLEF